MRDRWSRFRKGYRVKSKLGRMTVVVDLFGAGRNLFYMDQRECGNLGTIDPCRDPVERPSYFRIGFMLGLGNHLVELIIIEERVVQIGKYT